jgi:D-alanine-D-alanine ligase
MDDVEYPVIVKPKMEAVSMGLTIVDNQCDLHEAVRSVIENFQQQALVEAFIPGREFAVGVLGNGPDLEVLPIVEIDLGGDPNAIQTQDDKMRKPPQKICPAQIPDALADEMRHLARDAFSALGLHDFARIDVRMDAEGSLYILEINSMASLGLTGSYVHSAEVARVILMSRWSTECSMWLPCVILARNIYNWPNLRTARR